LFDPLGDLGQRLQARRNVGRIAKDFPGRIHHDRSPN
jgi:hypothetical protein